MSKFKASVQYDDWKGSSAADKSDAKTLDDYMLENGLRAKGEVLVGVQLWVGESHGNKLGSVYIEAYLHDGQGFDNVRQAIQSEGADHRLKKVPLEMTLEDFVSHFKRFAVTLSHPGLGLEGREFAER